MKELLDMKRKEKNGLARSLGQTALLAVLIGTVVAGCFRSDLPATGSERRQLLAVGDAGFPPFTYLEHGDPRGFDVDLLSALAGRKNLDIKVRLLDWTQAVQAVRSGEADILLGVSDFEERRAYLDFSERMLTMKSCFFVERETFSIAGIKDLGAAGPVGVEKGDISSQYLQKTYPEIRLREYPNQEAAMEALAKDEIKVAALDYYSGLRTLQKLNLGSKIKVTGEAFLEAAYCLGVKKE